jgi:transketolase
MSTLDTRIANTIRGLAMDAVQAANSGHPGMPMGMADVACVLWTRFLNYDPSKPDWFDRDRFILSAGHGSMLLYSMLYLTGQALTLENLKKFRQLHSPAAGHPEVGEAPGIETTTGPLGQGFSNGVGFAIAEAWLRARFGEALCNHWTYAIVSDGDLMEGVAAEAASLAGHLGLGRLIYLWDDNHITIDGNTEITFTEDILARFRAYGWHTQAIDGHDPEAIAAAITAARDMTNKPSIIACRTTIGKGSPNKGGKSAAHGAPLGVEEVKLSKLALGLNPEEHFAVPEDVVAAIREKDGARKVRRQAWEERLSHHEEAELFNACLKGTELKKVLWPVHAAGTSLATRKASEGVIQAIAAGLPNLIGGSADLAESNLTHIKGESYFAPGNHARNLAFGIREHAMAAAANGIALHGGLRPYCATFLVFHDYHRPSVRLAALMKQPVIFVYTHDSIWVGEDGPTHQPIEHLASMRLIPNLHIIRPADANEAVEAWKLALERKNGPTALIFTRQNLVTLDRSVYPAASSIEKGAYVLKEAAEARATLLASGSEVELALQAAELLAGKNIAVRVVNMASQERFAEQELEYQREVLGAMPKIGVEAGRSLTWARYGVVAAVGIDRFGASAPGKEVAKELGLTAEAVVKAVEAIAK